MINRKQLSLGDELTKAIGMEALDQRREALLTGHLLRRDDVPRQIKECIFAELWKADREALVTRVRRSEQEQMALKARHVGVGWMS
jgi:hypothetical protein